MGENGVCLILRRAPRRVSSSAPATPRPRASWLTKCGWAMLLVTLLGSAFGLWKGYEGDHLETLQPWQWIDAHEVHVGGQAPLPLDVVEMGLPEGITGKVIDIAPCPPFRAGRGRVILTTVNHLHRDVWELALRDRDGTAETIRPTGAHLFYSHSRGQWLAASELQAGERLDGVSGPVAVVSTRRIPGTHRVYNFTVQGEHLYRVTQAGVLVHNNGCATARASNAGRAGKQARLQELGADPNVSSADRGWIQQEINSIERGQRTNIRVPPGKNMAHRRGFEAKKGYGYGHSDLQDIDLHKLQHKHEGY